MSIYQITPYALERDFREFLDRVAGHIDALARRLVGSEVNIPCSPKRMGQHIAPYSFAATVLVLLDYARGNSSVSREFIENAVQDYAFLLTGNAYTDQAQDLPWGELRHSPIARVLLASIARLRLGENQSINENELFALCGFTSQRAIAQGLSGKENNGVWEFEPEGVNKILRIIHEAEIK